MSKENQKTILLVEDEAATMMLESKQLMDHGYNVIQALDGHEAVAKVSTHPGVIDLILMDIDLGQGIDGTEAAEIILKNHDIPIIFVSSHMEHDVVEKTEKITSYGYVLKNSSVTILMASIRMAFRLHEAHLKLRESEERYRSIVENVPLGMFQSSPEGKFFYVNQALVEILKYDSPQDLIDTVNGTSIAEAIYEDPARRPVLVDEVSHARGEWKAYENRYRRKDGIIIDALLSFGKKIDTLTGQSYLLGFVRDITEKKKMERDTINKRKYADNGKEKANGHLKAVLSALPDVMFELDMDRRFLAFHARETDELYMQPHEFIGKKIDEVMPPDMIPLLDIMFRETLEKGSHSGTAYKLNVPKGETWYELSASIMGDPSTTTARFIVLVRDITERKRNEKALFDALEENRALLRELQHRVKNSLTMIGSLTILEGARSGNPAVETAMKNLEGRIKILSDLYSMLYESGNVREIRADIYLGRLCGSVMKVYGKHTGVSMILDEVTMNVKKASVLGLILNELLTNAIKYARGGMEDGLIEVALHVREDRVELSVADNGPGLPEDFPVQKEGALGLKLVDMMAQQLKGALTYESGEKTIFTIGFPVDGRLT
ncbi:MAG: hypothetical protein CVV44_13870 [Spirochaetae bacterium HGW-Spirochaetae-1]|nr:MAG: hypothetical protein CVV44_13870 [Spirochaetae bacterium HGW-Spirochaetae-1]